MRLDFIATGDKEAAILKVCLHAIGVVGDGIAERDTPINPTGPPQNRIDSLEHHCFEIASASIRIMTRVS